MQSGIDIGASENITEEKVMNNDNSQAENKTEENSINNEVSQVENISVISNDKNN